MSNSKFYLLVAGSRTFVNYDFMVGKLDAFLSRQIVDHRSICIVSGGARGADKLAERYANERGFELRVFPADWDKFGKSAGYRRNEQMHQFIAQFEHRGCVCFWDGESRGTAHNFKLAEQFKTPLRVVRFEAGSKEPASTNLKGDNVMEFRDKYWFLSNFYPCKIRVGELVFECVESAFQAYKCANVEDRKQFVGLNGAEAKKLGRKIKLRADWNDIKLTVMEKLIHQKFNSYTELAKMLCNIEGKITEDNTWNDTFWGVCNGKGHNHLGRILMTERDHIMQDRLTDIVDKLTYQPYWTRIPVSEYTLEEFIDSLGAYMKPNEYEAYYKASCQLRLTCIQVETHFVGIQYKPNEAEEAWLHWLDESIQFLVNKYMKASK